MPKEFAFEQCLLQGGAVDRNHHAVAPSAVVMQGPRHQLLSGSTISTNQDGGVGGRDLLDHLEHFPHCRSRADHLVARRFERETFDVSPQLAVFQAQSPHVHGPDKDRQQRLQVKRLEHVIEGADFHCLNRRRDRSLARHDDPDQARVDCQGLAKQLNAVHAGHHQVAEEDIKVGILKRIKRLRGPASADRDISLVGQRLAQGVFQFRLVIRDKQFAFWRFCHRPDFPRPTAIPREAAPGPRRHCIERARRYARRFLCRPGSGYVLCRDIRKRYVGKSRAPAPFPFLLPLS